MAVKVMHWHCSAEQCGFQQSLAVKIAHVSLNIMTQGHDSFASSSWVQAMSSQWCQHAHALRSHGIIARAAEHSPDLAGQACFV